MSDIGPDGWSGLDARTSVKRLIHTHTVRGNIDSAKVMFPSKRSCYRTLNQHLVRGRQACTAAGQSSSGGGCLLQDTIHATPTSSTHSLIGVVWVEKRVNVIEDGDWRAPTPNGGGPPNLLNVGMETPQKTLPDIASNALARLRGMRVQLGPIRKVQNHAGE